MFSETPSTENCVFKCFDNYEWQNGLCVAKKQTSICTGLPENAQWNSVATVLQEWKGAAWDPSDVGIYSEEESLTECRFKCRENYTWSDGICVANTRVMDCSPRPAHSLWNATHFISQTWNGKEWLPALEPQYSVAASDTECKYICDTGYYPLDGECVEHPCDYDPCDDVNNSTGVCEEINNLSLPYSCECEERYRWSGRTGCRAKDVALGNICTGAVKCYDDSMETGCTQEGADFYGQDAQYADTGYCTPKNFVFDKTYPSQITVIDKNTGLEWDRTVRTKSWTQAKDYCENMEYAGHADWRLPTIKELLTIIDHGTTQGINTDYFGSIGLCWTGNESLANGNNAWMVSTSETAFTRGKGNSQDFICVRDTDPQHTIPENSSFEDVSNEIIKDLTTNLYWQKGYVTGKTWQEALEYCENLTLDGYSDWRLPNINELISLVNYGAKNPASDFINMPSKPFWSSTTSLSYSTGNALYIKFATGDLDYISKTYTYDPRLTRCVRSDICGEGEFLSGKNCLQNPCDENSCLSDHTTGICTPLTETTFSCSCEEGYIWDALSSTCRNDPCFDNKCVSMDGSDGICTPIDGTNFTCGCTDDYFWNGSRCMTKRAFGNICTGITKCYDDSANEISCEESGDFYGQDAQYAAKGFCTPQSFTITVPVGHPGEEIVIDNNLGLEWQKNIAADKFDWQHAITYCADLDYGGYDDWRLPKPKELLSIINYSRDNPPTDTVYFAEAGTSISNDFWTSKKYIGNSSKAWGVGFYKGYDGGNLYYYSNDTQLYVRCVRGRILPESPTLTVSTKGRDEIVTDNLTGLIWKKTFINKASWASALAYCENLTYAGYDDWRLPNILELASLLNLDYRHASDFPSINTVRPPWSSSTNPFTTTTATHIWTVTFYGGDISIKLLNDGSSVNTMCVR